MRKFISILMSSVVVMGVSTGCNLTKTNGASHGNTKVENLDFDFKVNPNTFELKISENGKDEVVSKAQKERKISDFKESKDEASWVYPDDKTRVSIKKQDKYLDIKIKSTEKKESNFEWPYVEGDSYYMPLFEGKYIPSDDKYFKEYLNDSTISTIESLSMQFFTVNKNDKSIIYIIDNKFNNEIKFDTKGKINFKFKHEFPSINDKKEYGFKIYLTKNDITQVAKTYKNYIIANGEFTTLEEKAKSNKNIEKLYGAPHIYFWDKSIIASSDIKWNEFKGEMSQQFIDHIKKLLNEVEDGKEISNILDQIKNQDYFDKYQKNQIVNGLNIVLLSEKFYDKDIFGNIDNEDRKKLTKIELVKQNKKLLKSKLKKSTVDDAKWSNSRNVDVINEMHKSGVKNAWIGFDDIDHGFVSPDLVDKAVGHGYLVGPYDSYHSIHKPGEEKWSTAKFEDKSLYENATVEDKNGKKLSGFQNTGRKLNPTLSLPSVKNRTKKIGLEGYKFNSWFIDCDATGEVYDDYSKDHITTQEQDLKARLGRMEYIRDNNSMVIGSEGGNDFASKTIAFAHGIETPAFSWIDPDMNKNKESEYYVGRYFSPTGGVPEVFSKQIPVKEQYKRIFIDPTYSIPLFKLVYNDSVISTHQWLWGTFKIKDEVSTRMMNEVLYNVPPMYHLDKGEWDKYKKDITSHTKIWSEFSNKAIKEEMTEFKFISPDRKVQLSKFGKDLKVVANFSDKDYQYEKDTIKANSLIIYDKNNKVEYSPK